MSNIEFVNLSSVGTVPLAEVALRLHPIDEVAICKTNLHPGTTLDLSQEQRLDGMPAQIPVRRFTPSGHKIALKAVKTGDAIHRYGQIIGFATQDVVPGDHVHTHNLGVQDFGREYIFSVDVQPVAYV